MRLNNKAFINITLPEHYVDDLKLAAYEEMRTASTKYKLNLTSEEKDNIFYHSFKQLEFKVKEIARTDWEIGQKKVSIRVDHYEELEIDIPKDLSSHMNKSVLRESKKCSFDYENNKGSIPLNELQSEIMTMLDKFLRTAIMYGVGSYA